MTTCHVKQVLWVMVLSHESPPSYHLKYYPKLLGVAEDGWGSP